MVKEYAQIVQKLVSKSKYTANTFNWLSKLMFVIFIHYFLETRPKMTFTFWSPCLHLPSAGVTGVHPTLFYVGLGDGTRASCTLGKHLPTEWHPQFLGYSQNHFPALESSVFLHFTWPPGLVRTLHIPVGKARSTRFGFHIFQTLSLKGTDHSLPLHFHTLFSDKQQQQIMVKYRYQEESVFHLHYFFFFIWGYAIVSLILIIN